MGSETYVNYGGEYLKIAEREKQSSVDFDSFITSNRNDLSKAGVDVVSQQSLINERLSKIDNSIREVETKVEYHSYRVILDEDVNKLDSILAKYPKSMTNDVYLQYASETTTQIQYSVNHLIVFKEYLDDNEQALRDASY